MPMRRLSYSDPFSVLWQGDALEVLAELEPESVDLVVTSPPYYGLRSYPDTERVWGGVEACDHVWEIRVGSDHRSPRSDAVEIIGSSDGAVGRGPRAPTPITATCSLCGVGRGSYGNEPLADCGAWIWSILTGEPMELCNACYLCHSLLVLRAIRRVMRPWATCWWVIDDSMAGSWGNMSHKSNRRGYLGGRPPQSYAQGSIKAQDRMGIPERLSLALQADGWHWRSTIIWAKAREIENDGQWTGKGTTMPESIKGWRWVKHQIKAKQGDRATNYYQEGAGTKQGPGVASRTQREAYFEQGIGAPEYADCPSCPKCSPNGGYVLRKGNWRPTDSYERIIMLAKGANYFGDSEAVKEAATTPLDSKANQTFMAAGGKAREVYGQHGGDEWVRSMSRNPRSVWEINPEPTKMPHFATFPSAIPRKIILAMTSAKGNCPRCGQPWSPVIERHQQQLSEVYTGQALHDYKAGGAQNPSDTKRRILEGQAMKSQVVEWWPSCSCHQEGGEPYPVTPAVVLDPFAGTGTTLQEAKKLGRRSVGIEMVPTYCELAVKRIQAVSPPMESLV